MASKEFGTKLKELRLNAGLTQKQVYDTLQIPQSTFSSWEIGKSEPSADMLLRLCRLYRVDDIFVAFGYNGIDKSGMVKPTYPELNHIKKYRVLDSHGKEAVDLILNHEYARCTESDDIDQNSHIPHVTPEEIEMCKKLAKEDMERREKFNNKGIG